MHCTDGLLVGFCGDYLLNSLDDLLGDFQLVSWLWHYPKAPTRC